ncbi:Fc.00g027720.m01.CDS01 [Cosmosporella sp. VM-42]
MPQSKILLTGATGYVYPALTLSPCQKLTHPSGGSVLTALLSSSNRLIQQRSITALVRKQNQADILAAKGVTPVLFRDLDDVDHLRTVASEHDVVIHTASGFHLESAKALVEGLGERKAETRREVHFIHAETSGTWNFMESPPSSYIRTYVFYDRDRNYDHLRNLESQWPFSQRTTLLQVISSAESAGVRSYIIMPPDIYGRGTGLFSQYTPQLFGLIRSAIKEGGPEYVGEGVGGAGHVHITDLASLYEVLLGQVLKGCNVPSGVRGLYFTETGYHSWLDVATRIGEIGIRLNPSMRAGPRSITVEDAAQKWTGGDVELLENSFCLRNKTKPELAIDLGWNPKKEEEDWWEWIEEVWKLVLEERP